LPEQSRDLLPFDFLDLFLGLGPRDLDRFQFLLSKAYRV